MIYHAVHTRRGINFVFAQSIPDIAAAITVKVEGFFRNVIVTSKEQPVIALIEPLETVLAHEVGHTFQLPHNHIPLHLMCGPTGSGWDYLDPVTCGDLLGVGPMLNIFLTDREVRAARENTPF
jgi:hypothetical protein